MPRIRTIKPEFWTDEKIVTLPFAARLLFIGLWNLCDDQGYLFYEPERIRFQLFPSDNVDVVNLLKRLCSLGVIDVVASRGKEVIRVNNFLVHQRVNRPSKSGIAEAGVSEHSVSPHGVLTDGKGMGMGKGKEVKDSSNEESRRASPDLSTAIRAVFEHYRLQHPKAHKKPHAKMPEWKKIRDRLKEDYSVEDLKLAIDGCHRSAFHQGENDQRTKYDGLELIVRDSSHVVKFMELATGEKHGDHYSKPARTDDRGRAKF